MLYVQAKTGLEACRMYKILKDIPYYNKDVKAGDVIVSRYMEDHQEELFGFTKSDLGNRFNDWFEEIDEAYYYNTEMTERVDCIDVNEAFDLSFYNSDKCKNCFADEDKAYQLLKEDKNRNLPKNLEFKTFITSYMLDFYKNTALNYTPEPIEVIFNEAEFLLGIDWYKDNHKDLEKFLSKEVYNSYIDKIILNQEHDRIQVVLTSSKYRE